MIEAGGRKAEDACKLPIKHIGVVDHDSNATFGTEPQEIVETIVGAFELREDLLLEPP